MSSLSDEEDSIATQLQSSHLVEIVSGPGSNSLRSTTPAMPQFLPRSTRRFSVFIPDPPVHERDSHNVQHIHDGSSFLFPNFHGVHPNSSLPTISPGSMHNSTLSTKIPVNYRHSLTQENLPTNQQQLLNQN